MKLEDVRAVIDKLTPNEADAALYIERDRAVIEITLKEAPVPVYADGLSRAYGRVGSTVSLANVCIVERDDGAIALTSPLPDAIVDQIDFLGKDLQTVIFGENGSHE